LAGFQYGKGFRFFADGFFCSEKNRGVLRVQRGGQLLSEELRQRDVVGVLGDGGEVHRVLREAFLRADLISKYAAASATEGCLTASAGVSTQSTRSGRGSFSYATTW